MSTNVRKFTSEQVEFLDFFLKVEAGESEEYSGNLYYSFMQLVTNSDTRVHMDWIGSSRSYDCVPADFGANGDIYFGINLTGDIQQNSRNTVGAITRVASLYADFDGKDLVDVASDEYKALVKANYDTLVAKRSHDGKNVKKSAEKAMKKKAEMEARTAIFTSNRQYYLDLLLQKIEETTAALPPSLIVFSGGGFHCYWLLDQAKYLLTPADRAACIEAQANFVVAVGADEGARDIARVLRVIGTTNTKYPDNNTVAYIKKDSGIRYTFQHLADFANNSAAAKAKRTNKSATTDRQDKASFLRDMPGDKEKNKGKFKTIPGATMTRLHELYPNPLQVFQHLALFTDENELQDEGTEWRIPGYGGLLVVKEGEKHYGSWRCHGEEYGGDIVYAWLWAKDGIYLPRKKGDWSLEDNKHWVRAVCEMLAEKDVELDYDLNIFFTDAETAKRIKAFFESDNPRSLFAEPADYQALCNLVTNNRAKKYGRNEESKLKLGGEFPIYRLSDMREYDMAKDEVIERMAYRGLVSLLYAPPKTGKSYLAVEIAVSLMLGKQVAKQLSTRTRTSRVLYIAAETDPDFKNRTIRSASKFGATEDKLETNLTYFDGDAAKFRLDDADWINRFAASYLHEFEAKGELPDLIVIDTLRTATNGGDVNENDNLAMSRVIANAKLLCKALGGAACILIHHTNRGNTDYAGAGSLEGDCGVVLHAEKTYQENRGVLWIKSKKNKLVNNDPDAPILAVEFVSGKDGATLGYYDKNKVVKKQEDLNENQARVLQVIYEEYKAGRQPNYKKFGELLAKRYSVSKDVNWINKKKELAIDPLTSKGFIGATGDLNDKATTLFITQKGREYIESSRVTEEDLADDPADTQQDSGGSTDE